MQNLSSKLPDGYVGIGSASVGSMGLTIQALTDVANLGLVVLNIILAIGGLVLLYFKIGDKIRQIRDRKK